MRDVDWLRRVIYLDDALIAVAKPAAILTHPGGWSAEHYTVMNALRALLGHHVFPLHRLDRPTSGVLLFARNSKMTRCYRQLFELNGIQKTYWGVVRGWSPQSGQIDRALRQPESDREQSASTAYRSVASASLSQPIGSFPSGRFSLVELKPGTGRWHQIRRHMNGLGYPIVGDAVHGDTHFNRYAREHLGVDRLMLHAASVEFDDPRGLGRRRLVAPLEADMAALWQGFKWPLPNSEGRL